MKILKPGKVEQREFVCPKCGCVFVADESDLHFTPTEAKTKCPCCWLEQKWMRGEPYEEPTQDARNRLARILFAMPAMDDCNSTADYLIQRGVTFKEG